VGPVAGGEAQRAELRRLQGQLELERLEWMEVPHPHSSWNGGGLVCLAVPGV